MIAASGRGLEDFFAQRTILEEGERRLLRGVLQRDDVLAGHLFVFGGLRGGSDVALAQAGQLSFFIDHDRRRGGISENVLAILRRQRRLFLIQRFESCFVGVRELRAGADEVAVVALDQPFRFCIEVERVALVVDRLYAGEEFRIEIDRVGVCRQLRRLFRFDLLHRVVGVRLRQVEENLRGARQQIAALLHRDDRVVEGRWIGIVRDDLDFREAALHALFDRGLVVGVLDLVEWRRLKRQRAGVVKRIGLRDRGGRDQAEDERQSFHAGTQTQGRSRPNPAVTVSSRRPAFPEACQSVSAASRARRSDPARCRRGDARFAGGRRRRPAMRRTPISHRSFVFAVRSPPPARPSVSPSHQAARGGLRRQWFSESRD